MVRRIVVSKRWMIIEYDYEAWIIDAEYYDLIADAIKRIKERPEQTIMMNIKIRPKEEELEVEEEIEEVPEEEEEALF
jgi:hypothetical protein